MEEIATVKSDRSFLPADMVGVIGGGSAETGAVGAEIGVEIAGAGVFALLLNCNGGGGAAILRVADGAEEEGGERRGGGTRGGGAPTALNFPALRALLVEAVLSASDGGGRRGVAEKGEAVGGDVAMLEKMRKKRRRSKFFFF